MLLSLARAWGAEPVDLGHAPDRRDAVRAALDRGADEADLVLTSGGASAGDEDHVSALLKAEANLTSWRIALKPGRPLALAVWKGVPVMGLPGNPVAALVCALVFGRPAAGVLSGEGWHEPLAFTVPAAFEKRKKPGRREFLRARLDAEGRAEVFASEGSGRISGLPGPRGLSSFPTKRPKSARATPSAICPMPDTESEGVSPWAKYLGGGPKGRGRRPPQSMSLGRNPVSRFPDIRDRGNGTDRVNADERDAP